MKVVISRAVFDQILDHADRYPDEEVCGLLLGRHGVIESARPAANVAPDRARTFELDPAVLLAAHRDARDGGPAIQGHYHSHPNGDARPSPRDAAHARPGAFWLIVARGEARLFEAQEAGLIHGVFVPREIELR
jgi:proteasome lid subunit RPN8/RPN11